MNVSQPTINRLYALIGECFQYNRWFDRFVSVLGVKFACNSVADKIHENYAHWFPMASDVIGKKCLETYNIPVEYNATDEGKQDYDSVTNMITQMEEKVIKFQNILTSVAKTAVENDDLNIYVELQDIIKKYRKHVEMAILLNDKIKFYGENNIMKFDNDSVNYWMLKTKGKL